MARRPSSPVADPVTDPGSSPGSVTDQAGRFYLAFARAGRTLRGTVETPIGPGAFSALWTLAAQGPMRLSDLAAVESVARPTMTRIVASLEQRGYVARETDPADGRAFLVTASRSGRSLIAKGKAVRVQALAARLAALPDDQAERVEDVISLLEVLAEG